MGDNEETTSSEKVLILPLNEDSKKITQLLSNEKAMKMLEILADKPMSASDVAENLDMPLTTVKYNLDGLIEADLIQVKETKWSRKGREVKIYEPVQKLIVVAPGSMKKDKASVLSMLKKYLGLVAGAVFAATGLEAITRTFGTGPGYSQEAATAPVFDDDAMGAMSKNAADEELMEDAVFENEPMTQESFMEETAEVTEEIEAAEEMTAQEMPSQEFAEEEFVLEEESMEVAFEEEAANMEYAEYGEYEMPAESMEAAPSEGITGTEELAQEMVASSAPNGSDTGAELMRDGMSKAAGNQTSADTLQQTFTDNVTAVTEPAGSIFQDGILSHISVWFFFGCLFVIALLFVREMYYRKKNI